MYRRSEMAEERGPLVKAKVQLVLNHPFFGVLVCHMPTIPLPPAEMAVLCGGPPTAAVDGKSIYYNEEWVNTLSEKARMGLLAHEVLHPALGHLWRRGGRNLEIWNYAVDFAANDIIKRMIPNVELPEGGCYDSKFQGMCAEQIYGILEKKAKQRPDRKNGDGHMEKPREGQGQGKGKGKGGSKGGAKKGKGGSGDEKDDQKDKGEGQGGGKGDGEKDDEKKGGKGGSSDAEEQAKDACDKAEEKGDGPGNGGSPSNEQSEGSGANGDYDDGSLEDLAPADMEQHWKDVLVQAAMVAKQKGNLPGQLARLVEEVTEPRVPWQAIIEQFLTEILRDDYDMLKQDRRFIEQGIYFPDLASNATNVAVAVDTSGSIGKKELTAFVSEIAGILRCRGVSKMRILACDAKVTMDETIGQTDPLPENFPGGGGTDFRPVFKKLRDDGGMERPALLIYLTDGYGTFPDRDELGIPVIWLMTVGGWAKEENLPKATFGTTIPYPIEEER